MRGVDEVAAANVGRALKDALEGLAVLDRVARAEAHEVDPGKIAWALGMTSARLIEKQAAWELAEEARKMIRVMPVDVRLTTLYEIVLAESEPEEALVLYVQGDKSGREIVRIDFRYDWGGSARRSLHGEDFALIERIARLVVPELMTS